MSRIFSPLSSASQSIPNSACGCVPRFCQLFVLFSSSLRGIIMRCKELLEAEAATTFRKCGKCSMCAHDWFPPPVSFMAFYLLFYLSAVRGSKSIIAVPDVLVHCHLDDLFPFAQKYAIVLTLRGSVIVPFALFCCERPGRLLAAHLPVCGHDRCAGLLCHPATSGPDQPLGVRQRPLRSGRADALCRRPPGILPLHPCNNSTLSPLMMANHRNRIF